MAPQNPIEPSDLGLTNNGVVQDAPIQESEIANKRTQKLAEKSAEKIEKILGGEKTSEPAHSPKETEAPGIPIEQMPAAMVVQLNVTNVDSVADKASDYKESQSMQQSAKDEADSDSSESGEDSDSQEDKEDSS